MLTTFEDRSKDLGVDLGDQIKGMKHGLKELGKQIGNIKEDLQRHYRELISDMEVSSQNLSSEFEVMRQDIHRLNARQDRMAAQAMAVICEKSKGFGAQMVNE